MNKKEFCAIINDNLRSFVPEISEMIYDYYYNIVKLNPEEYFKVRKPTSDMLMPIDGEFFYGYFDANGRFIVHNDNDLPAVEWHDGGEREWYQHGKWHRDGDLPAIQRYGHYEAWYQFGREHRDGDLPAVIYPHMKEWYKHGKLHRDTKNIFGRILPALIYKNKKFGYYINGEKVNAIWSRLKLKNIFNLFLVLGVIIITQLL